MNKSIWVKYFDGEPREALNKSIKTDVAVIGGGLAGILTAELLQNAGKRVVVLEGKRIASGQSEKTTAKITAQHGAVYSDLIKNFGSDMAKEYLNANLQAVNWYDGFIKERNISCDFERCSAFIYTESNTARLMAEEKALRRLDFKAELTFKTELPIKCTALEMKNQAQFNPAKFITAVAEYLNIYENTYAERVEGNKIYTNRGSVEADNIVFTCHYPFVNFPALYFARMYQERSYVLALKNAIKIKNMYLGIDRDGLSFRSYGNLLLLGGGSHRSGDNKCGGKYNLLKCKAEKLFKGALGVAQWSAEDCITADKVPYIGKFSKSKENWYVATGFGKWGMTSSAVAARIIADSILGRENKNFKIFNPSRINPKAVAGILKEAGESAKGLIAQKIVLNPSEISEIQIGKGGIIKKNGKRMGVYRESEARYYLVDTKCPHFGCGLNWNDDEKSWDCPCHGSRFDYRGRLIDNPAQKGIECQVCDNQEK